MYFKQCLALLDIWAETLRGYNVQSTSSVLQECNEKERKGDNERIA